MLKKLDTSAWQQYFDLLSKCIPRPHMTTKLVQVTVESRDLGDQEMNQWSILEGLSYDPKNNEFFISIEKHTHAIPNPVEIYIDEGAEGLSSLEIIDQAGVKHIMRLKNPLLLPAETKEYA